MSMKLENVNFIYSQGSVYQKQALKNINLEIHDQEFIGIVGHTGSGKSTLTQLLNGIEKASSGTINYNGQDIYSKNFKLQQLRSKVGLVFQYPEHQLFEISVLEDVKFGPKNLGLALEEVEERAKAALKSVGIHQDLYAASPHSLSGGQKRRVAIAGVLAMNPEILILDEPTAGLDPFGRDELMKLLKKLHEERKMTIILVSHSMDDVAKCAQRVLVINNGEIVFDDAPEKVFTHEKELSQMGLDIPQASRVVKMLAKAIAAKGETARPNTAAKDETTKPSTAANSQPNTAAYIKNAALDTTAITPEQGVEAITAWLKEVAK